MARARLVAAKFTSKGALVLTYRGSTGSTMVNTTPRDGVVTVAEAAFALGCSTTQLYRMRDRGTLTIKSRNKTAAVPVAELRRLKRG